MKNTKNIFNIKINNFVSYFVIIPILLFLFVSSIIFINRFHLGYSYFSMIYMIFLLLVFLFYKVEVAFFLNYIFSFVTIIMIMFSKNTLIYELYIIFQVGFTWLLLWIFNRYFQKEEMLKHRLDQAFADTDSKKNIMQQEIVKKNVLLATLKENLDRYYRLSNTVKFFTDNLTKEEIEKVLVDIMQKFFINSMIRTIHSKSKITDNIFMDWVRKQGTALFVEDLTKDYRFPSDLAIKFGFKSLLLIPILADNNIYCFLEISNTDSNHYTQDDMRLALILTDVVSLSITTELLIDKKKRLVRIDPLTNVYNRRYFFELCTEEFNRSLRYKTPLSMLMIDIDFFKNYNDTYGHLYGDEVLKSVVEAMKFKIRDIDILGRYGGEEFIIVLPVKRDVAYKKAEELRITVETKTKVTISIGVVSLKENITLNEFIDMADKALYKAKNAGRNQVVCYN